MENDHFKPAFPTSEVNHLKEYSDPGMTLRDYFAARAMQALVTSGLNTGAWEDYDDLARSSWSIADAMLRNREAS